MSNERSRFLADYTNTVFSHLHVHWIFVSGAA
jgi:hypothetical protein